jgi:hypothetical protein
MEKGAPGCGAAKGDHRPVFRMGRKHLFKKNRGKFSGKNLI